MTSKHKKFFRSLTIDSISVPKALTKEVSTSLVIIQLKDLLKGYLDCKRLGPTLVYIHNTAEFRGSYRFLSVIKDLGFGQIEWDCKKEINYCAYLVMKKHNSQKKFSNPNCNVRK